MTRDDGMGCEEALERLATYLDGELAPDDVPEMEKHLERCRSCFSRAEFERRLKERLRRDLGLPAVPVEFEERIRGILEALPEDS